MKNEIWLSKRILTDWPCYHQGGEIQKQSKVSRAYEIWERANVLSSQASNEFDLSDAILNLKRSLDQRLKVIESVYGFSKISLKNKPKHQLEILTYLGIVRPLILRKLLDIRNAIDHHDRKPPTKKRCLELVDIVWYFLKSTDALVTIQRSEIGYEGDGYFYEISINWKKNTVSIRGCFPADFLLENFEIGYLKLKYETIKKEERSIYLTGVLILDHDLLEIYKKALTLYS